MNYRISTDYRIKGEIRTFNCPAGKECGLFPGHIGIAVCSGKGIGFLQRLMQHICLIVLKKSIRMKEGSTAPKKWQPENGLKSGKKYPAPFNCVHSLHFFGLSKVGFGDLVHKLLAGSSEKHGIEEVRHLLRGDAFYDAMVFLGNIMFKKGFNAFGITLAARHCRFAFSLSGPVAEMNQVPGVFRLRYFAFEILNDAIISGIFQGTCTIWTSKEGGLGLAAFHMIHCTFVLRDEPLASLIAGRLLIFIVG